MNNYGLSTKELSYQQKPQKNLKTLA